MQMSVPLIKESRVVQEQCSITTAGSAKVNDTFWALKGFLSVSLSLTSVADHAHGGRGEDEDSFSQQGELPQDQDLLPEEADELRHAACRVGDLQDGTHNNSLVHWKRLPMSKTTSFTLWSK